MTKIFRTNRTSSAVFTDFTSDPKFPQLVLQEFTVPTTIPESLLSAIGKCSGIEVTLVDGERLEILSLGSSYRCQPKTVEEGADSLWLVQNLEPTDVQFFTFGAIIYVDAESDADYVRLLESAFRYRAEYGVFDEECVAAVKDDHLLYYLSEDLPEWFAEEYPEKDLTTMPERFKEWVASGDLTYEVNEYGLVSTPDKELQEFAESLPSK